MSHTDLLNQQIAQANRMPQNLQLIPHPSSELLYLSILKYKCLLVHKFGNKNRK